MLKNTLPFLVLTVMLLTACKNEPKTTPAVETPKLDLKAVEKTTTEGDVKLKQMEQLIQELNALPAAVKTKHAESVNNMIEELNGMLEKESVMVQELKAMQQHNENYPKGGGGTTDSGTDPVYQVNTFNEINKDITRYHERVDQIKTEIKTLSENQ